MKKRKKHFFGKNNRQIYILSFLILLSMRGLQAQVMIGELKDPQSFSVLELSTVKGGLRLPQLLDTQKPTLNVSDALANGLTIYNMDAGNVQFWNSTKWVPLLDEIVFSTGPFISVPSTATEQPVTITNASCSSYEYKLVIGSSYCVLEPTGSGSNTFTIKFSANDRTSARMVIVAVTEQCNNRSVYFTAKQAGK